MMSLENSDLGTQGQSQSDFWVIVEAVRQFYAKHQLLPVPGGLPDMKAQSNVYIQLQNIYKEKARRDAQEVLTAARAMAGGDQVDPAEVELFCTNARFIKLVNAVDGGTVDGTVDIQQVVGKQWAGHSRTYSKLLRLIAHREQKRNWPMTKLRQSLALSCQCP